jgi:hypothetical protein
MIVGNAIIQPLDQVRPVDQVAVQRRDMDFGSQQDV